MSEQELLDLAPLFAIGALDGAERVALEAALALSPRLQEEVLSFERVVSLLPLDLEPVSVSAATRVRVLQADRTLEPPVEFRSAERLAAHEKEPPRRSAAWPTWLATAATVLMALYGWALRSDRDQLRVEATLAKEQVRDANALNVRLQADLEKARVDLAQNAIINRLLGTTDLRFVNMGPQSKNESRARAIYNSATREAVLLVAGLDKAPFGKAYEVWIISGPVPTPAGVFQVDDQGTAVVVLPTMDETARVKTFAITLEPAEGVPAPTGPIVLAGNATPR